MRSEKFIIKSINFTIVTCKQNDMPTPTFNCKDHESHIATTTPTPGSWSRHLYGRLSTALYKSPIPKIVFLSHTGTIMQIPRVNSKDHLNSYRNYYADTDN